MSKSDFHMPSLAQHFNPPEGYAGLFGWMVGFSADTLFMNNVIERFTTYTKAQRASQGRIALALFLNNHNQPITLEDAPGVAHLPFSSLDSRPCRLIHAKVALLGFRGIDGEQSGEWCVRLLVSTGNWTRQTLEDSLDLAWRVDVFSDDLKLPSEELEKACADINAAHDLMTWLRNGAGGFFDTRLLKSNQAELDQKQLGDWIAECAKKAKGLPRFMDNRRESLLAQLAGQVKKTGGMGRNYLALGSGFYEGVKKENSVPEVPKKIIESLQKAGLLTQTAEIDLYVNPDACQAIASSIETLKGINVRPASAPGVLFGENSCRTLHAKFLFSASYRDNSNRCNGAWIYLGSGNLTKSGFAKSMSTNDGNLEAGVVFGIDGLLWKGGKKIEPAKVVTNLLPIDWYDTLERSEDLKPGDGWEPDQPSHFAPPVAWLIWHDENGSAELRLPDGVEGIQPFTILAASGSEVQWFDGKDGKAFPWTSPQPQQVRCRWIAEGETTPREAAIPVMDAYGRIAAMQLPALESMEAAWLQLADFPHPPEVDDPDDSGGSSGESSDASRTIRTNGGAVSSYPIRRMMELVEQVAAKQIEIPEYEWSLWCRHLEQTLIQAKTSREVECFVREFELNPLSPLRRAPFRPDFAVDGETEAGCQYEQALGRIEASWGVQSLPFFGEKQ